MKKLTIPLLAAAALAIPATAAAHDGWHHHHHGFAHHATFFAARNGGDDNDGDNDSGDANHFGEHHHKMLLAQLSGTGTDFGAATATANGTSLSDPLGTGTFAATINTTWSSAKTFTGDKGTLSCAPATAALTLVGATTTNTTVANLTGKTCTWTPSGSTTPAGAMFMGKDASVTGAGTAANLTGAVEKAFLWEHNGTVKGAVFAGLPQVAPTFAVFQTREHVFAARTGNCDGDH